LTTSRSCKNKQAEEINELKKKLAGVSQKVEDLVKVLDDVLAKKPN
jgi:hypothetical protein